MSSCRVEFTTTAAKELRKFDPGIRHRVLSGIDDLERAPRPPRCKKLLGETHAWRIRGDDCRVLYDVFGEMVLVSVVRVAHRREACNEPPTSIELCQR